jgi:hypothetical protein
VLEPLSQIRIANKPFKRNCLSIEKLKTMNNLPKPKLLSAVFAAFTILAIAMLPFPVHAPAPPTSGVSTCTGCSIGLVAPADSSTVSSTFYASFFVKNFTIVNPGSQVYTSPINNQGHLHVFLDNNYYTLWAQASAIPFVNIPAGSHTFRIELVNDTHAPFSPDVNITRSVTVSDPLSTSISNASNYAIAATILSLVAVVISAIVLTKVWKIKTP